MPEQRDADYYESGRATAPPGVYYISPTGHTSEGYNHTLSLNLTDPGSELIESTISSQNINNFLHQRLQTSPPYSNNCLPAATPSLNFSPTVSKVNVANNSFQSLSNSLDCSVTSDLHKFLSVNNFPFNNSVNNINNNNNNNNNNHQNLGSNYIDNFEFLVGSKPQPKALQSSYITQDNFVPHTPEQQPVSVINYPKNSKPDSVFLKELPTYSSCLFPNQQNQSKCTQDKEAISTCSDKNPKKNFEVVQKSPKSVKDDSELNYSIEELQQFLSKCGTKIKVSQDTGQDLVTNSVLHYLQKKNFQENSSCEIGDLSQILVSLGKHKPDDVSGLKKRESNEDSKLMNDFLAKIILEQEEKKFKAFDEKKRALRKELFDELGDGLEEKRTKRDAMSHYQEDKNHHKKSSNYGDFSQWDYFGQQDIQHSNNHNRRGHFSFGGAHQPPNPGWNSMRMGIPRQSNPYYSNPHGHMMPAHAHSDYRYNQWNNPNHKNLPNVHSAHSQNTILPQAKLDKHHEISNTKQDFNLPVGTTSDFTKFWTASRDLMHSTPSPIPDKFSRSSVHPDILTSTPLAVKSAPTLRTPPLAGHPKPIVNPLSDLQMLVTNQDTENPPQKSENFQQETVDLSAHSDISKQKESSDEKNLSIIKDKLESSSSLSVIQNKDKLVKSDCSESEKPVELTSKTMEKNAETELPTLLPENANNSAENIANGSKIAENKETVKEAVNSTENPSKSLEDNIKIEHPPISSKVEDIPVQNEKSEGENKSNEIIISKEKEMAVIKKESNDTEQCSEKTINPTGNKSSKELEEKSVNEASVNINGNEESSACEKRKAEEEFSPSKKICLQAESQLEKVVEGVGEESSDLPKVTSTSADPKSGVNESGKKSQKKKPSRKSRFCRLSSGQSSSSERSLSGKKSKIVGSKEDNRKKLKKSLCDVMDRRGPFLHLEGSKESPSSVVIVNFPKGDDEDEKDKSLIKKQASTTIRSKHQNELDYRGRSRNGMFCSTLSARYDAHTTDHTWICVFCKRGPHHNMLGDLFGPYIISRDENTALCDFSGDEKDISDAQKRGGRNKKSLRSNNMVEHFQKMSKKLRRTQSSESCLTGMTVISDDLVDEVRYEVWVHEQCAVWSPNVCLIGSRIIGMQEAIWSSAKVICSKCGSSGANIGCVYRNCPNRSHYSCAKESGWSLVQETFISTCPVHKPRLSLPSTDEQSVTL